MIAFQFSKLVTQVFKRTDVSVHSTILVHQPTGVANWDKRWSVSEWVRFSSTELKYTHEARM